jgi:hypothetical protein
VDPRESLLEGSEEILVVFNQELGVEPAHDVELGDRLVDVSGSDLHRLVNGVGPTFVPLAPGNVEGAEITRGDADVGGVEVAIDVVVGRVTVQPFTHQIGETPDPNEIVCGGREQTVVAVQPPTGQYFLGNRFEGRITQTKLLDRSHYLVIMLATRSRFKRAAT